MNIKNIRIQSKVDTKQNWLEHNPQLLENEIGYELETGNYKIGNAEENSWNDLEYASNIIKGEAKESIQSLSSQAISTGSMAFGVNSIAGCKGYRIISIEYPVDSDSTIAKYTLDISDGSTIDYAIGDICSIRLSNNYDNCGIIKSIDNDAITITLADTTNVPSTLKTGTITGDINTFRVPLTPTIGNIIICNYAVATGYESYAAGPYSHAEGANTYAIGKYSHTEGADTTAVYAAHAEGKQSSALGQSSHAEGDKTEAFGDNSHAEGNNTTASGYASHSEGYSTKSTAFASHAEGQLTEASGSNSHAEGISTVASGYTSHAEGKSTKSIGSASHAEGQSTEARGANSHAEGDSTISIGQDSHAEGYSTESTASHSHAEGNNTTASGVSSHAEGNNTTASGVSSHAEGNNTTASQNGSHAEGELTEASGTVAHSEGYSTKSTAFASHAEGQSTEARGVNSHAEGKSTTASGSNSHAEGQKTVANGPDSHAEGVGTVAVGSAQHVQGKYNKRDSSTKYSHIVGNGTGDDDSARVNIHTVDWSGNAWYAGDVYVGGSEQSDGSKLATEDYVNDATAPLNVLAGYSDDLVSISLSDLQIDFFNSIGESSSDYRIEGESIYLGDYVTAFIPYTGYVELKVICENSWGNTSSFKIDDKELCHYYHMMIESQSHTIIYKGYVNKGITCSDNSPSGGVTFKTFLGRTYTNGLFTGASKEKLDLIKQASYELGEQQDSISLLGITNLTSGNVESYPYISTNTLGSNGANVSDFYIDYQGTAKLEIDATNIMSPTSVDLSSCKIIVDGTALTGTLAEDETQYYTRYTFNGTIKEGVSIHCGEYIRLTFNTFSGRKREYIEGLVTGQQAEKLDNINISTASYETRPISLSGITTATYGSGTITNNTLGNNSEYTINYQGYVKLVVYPTGMDAGDNSYASIYIDGALKQSWSNSQSSVYKYIGQVNENIQIYTGLNNFKFETFEDVTNYNDGFITGEDKFKLDNINISTSPIFVTKTLSAENWVENDSGFYTQTINDNNSAYLYNNKFLSPAENITPSQAYSLFNAGIYCSEYSSEGTITFCAVGAKPSKDIPITMCFMN